jgi:Fe-S-cluster containining protein
MATEDLLVARLRLVFDGQPVDATVEVPAGLVAHRGLQKFAQNMSDLMISVAQANEEKAGRKISCSRGCAACCRQIPPLAPSEAHHLAALVDAMPDAQRTRIRERFDRAVQRATDAGLIERLRGRASLAGDELLALGLQYFREQIDCPFLENEACLIHAERPTECREFLVTSPPEKCREMKPGTVQGVKLPAKVSRVLRQMDQEAYGLAEKSAWVPLILALEWVADHPEEPAPRPGPEMLQSFVQALMRQPVDRPSGVSRE